MIESCAWPGNPKSRPKVLLAWSSGKDSAWSLHVLRQSGNLDVVALMTTFNEEFDRVAMHGVRRELVKAQAEMLELPMIDVSLPWPCSNTDYEDAMRGALKAARSRWGVTHVAFGDLFLEDVRRYRESRLMGTGLTPMFPLWQRRTDELAREMVSEGLRATITCVDPRYLDRSFAGRSFDERFLQELPATVDACGENGEFHSFVHACPMFVQPIPVHIGEIVVRDEFVFADVIHAAG